MLLNEQEITKLREQVAAQTAVIEKLTKRLASTNIIIEVVCAIHPDSACAKYELAENMNAIAIQTDSTQILDEVRRCDALKKLYESSEEYVIALKETRNRLAEECDEWRSKHDVACLTITNLQSKYECQLSATSKAMQGVVELTAERDALKQQRDELLAALERSLESFEYIAKYGNSCGHSQLRIPDLKAVIASVKGGSE